MDLPVFKRQSLKFLAFGSSLLNGVAILQLHAVSAQPQISPSVLAEIRQAPFSQLFKIQSGSATAYAVKDKDYNSKQPAIGFFSLWGEVPDQQRLEAYVLYCLPNQGIATSGTHLTEIVLLENGKELVRINQILGARAAQEREVQPGQYIPGTFFADPFYIGFWDPFAPGIGYVAPVYIQPVACSAGGTRFDLSPVKQQIARLPNQTLDVKLMFSNGMTDTWKLGGGTVKAIKGLPTIQKL